MNPLIETLNSACILVAQRPEGACESSTMRIPYLTYQGLTQWADYKLLNVRPLVVSDKAEDGEWVLRWTDIVAALDNSNINSLHALMASNPIAVVFDSEDPEVDAGHIWARMYSKLTNHGWQGLSIHIFDEEPMPEDDIDVRRIS